MIELAADKASYAGFYTFKQTIYCHKITQYLH